MTWTEAFRKGRARWLMWVAICSALAGGFLIKGGTQFELLWVVVIVAANGTAVGFAVGPAAEKHAMFISGFFAGTPFYFIASSIFVSELIEARQLHRGLLSDVIPLCFSLPRGRNRNFRCAGFPGTQTHQAGFDVGRLRRDSARRAV